jgi:hypothetical protein
MCELPEIDQMAGEAASNLCRVRAAVSSGCQPRLPRCRAQAAASRAKSFPGLGTHQAELRSHLQTTVLRVLGRAAGRDARETFMS